MRTYSYNMIKKPITQQAKVKIANNSGDHVITYS